MLALDKIPLTDDCREFTSAFEYAAIGMALVSPEGRFMRVNRALCRILGYSEAELLARDFQSLTVPADLQADLRQVNALLRDEIDHYQIEKRYIHKQGHWIQALLSVSLIHDEQGAPRYFISQIQDISAAQKAMEQFRVATARLNTLVEQLPMGVVLEDENRRIQVANQTFCALLHLPLPPAELENEDCLDVVGDSAHFFARPEFVLNRMNEIISNRRPVQNETLEMADGRLLRRDYIPVFVDDEYRGSLWTFRGVTAEKKR